MPEAEVNGTVLYYEEHNGGPGLFMALHGGPGCDHTYLREAVAPMRDWAHVVLPDLRGQGRSARPDRSTITIKRVVDDIDALRAHLGAEQMVLYGHSYGGFLALEYALAYPERLLGLILSATGSAMDMGHFVEREMRKQAKIHPEAVMSWTNGYADGDDDGFRDCLVGSLPMWFHNVLRPEWKAQFEDVIFSTHGGLPLNHDLRNYNVTDRLGTIQVPTLVLQGKYDFILPIEQGERLRAGIPHAEYVLFEDSGHFFWMEEREKHARAVRSFLQRTAAPEVPA